MKSNRFRVASILTDGRKVYYSRFNRVYILEEKDAMNALAVGHRNVVAVDRDPFVFSMDLTACLRRSKFLSALQPFVMVKEATIEPASSAIDPGAYVIGGRLAIEAGKYSRSQG